MADAVTTNSIRDFFDARAAAWDAEASPNSLERLKEIVETLPVRRGQRVLDIGCGTGVLFPVVAPKVGEAGLIVAVDISRKMLDEARTKVGGARVARLQADVMDLPLAAASFDAIICYSVFPHFSDQQRGLIALSRALKRDGWLTVCHSNSRAAINEFHRSRGGIIGGHALPENSAMKRLIARAGLRLERLEDRSDRYIVLATKAARNP